jgi:hypothetical protein
MEFIQHRGRPVALLTLQDLSAEEHALAALIDEAIEKGCSAFILPSEVVKRGLSLLKGGLIDALRQRFTNTQFKAVIAGPLPPLSGLAVKSLVKAYGVGDSVFFADNVEDALDRLASA